MHKIKNILLTFLSILFSLALIQCKNITETNTRENSKNPISVSKEPESFKDYYPSGKLKTQGQLIDNKKTGKWVSYYENGELSSIKHYKEDVLDGYQKMDYSQILYMEGYSKNGVKVGTWKSYIKEDKTLKYVKHFDENGNPTGEWKSYYDSGEILSVENYLNNKAHGQQLEYFKNGNISSIGEKRDGKKDGIWKYYYDNGTIAYQKEFDDDVENGKYIQYHKNGQVHKTGSKKNFKNVGSWKIYDNSGNLIETVHYE